MVDAPAQRRSAYAVALGLLAVLVLPVVGGGIAYVLGRRFATPRTWQRRVLYVAAGISALYALAFALAMFNSG